MSTLLSTKLNLTQRLNELKIHDSDLNVYCSTFYQIIGDQTLKGLKIEYNNKDMIRCLSPLLTALTCDKEPINLDKVTALSHKLKKNSSFCYRNEHSTDERWVEVISWKPKAFLYHNFLTNEECDHLISTAKPHMAKSKVHDKKTGGGIESSSRTSTGAGFSRGYNQIVRNIEKRISDFTFIPVENGEPLQVIHYEVGQKFDPHFDGLERIATVLMYLSDVEEGGETVFPDAKGNNGKQKLTVLPKKRDALLFWNMRLDGSVDPSSKHAGCPVIKGNKWAATKWLHVGEYKTTKKI